MMQKCPTDFIVKSCREFSHGLDFAEQPENLPATVKGRSY